MKRFNWTPSALTKLRKLSKTQTMQQVADEIGCNKNAVRGKARSEGIKFQKYGERHHSAKYTDHDVYLARALVDEGLTMTEAGKKLEIPQPVVSMYYRNVYRNHDSVQY